MSKRKLLAIVLTVVMVLSLVPQIAFADAGDTPKHSKNVSKNEDGTYKIELTVTGDADTETQETGKANIVLVYDVSQSMSTAATGSSYSRADQAEDVIHDFLTALAKHQNKAKDNINVALVTFAVNANTVQTWTTDVTGLADRFDDGGENNAVKFTYNGYGTNWQAALNEAAGLVDDDLEGPVFVIMLTDGAPTASGNGNNAIAPTGASIGQLRGFYNAATGPARTIAQAVEATEGAFYGIYAYGDEADLFDDLMYFADKGNHRGDPENPDDMSAVIGDTEDAKNYFKADNTATLNSAIDSIFKKIASSLGVSQVAINDGTTTNVNTSSGDISLVKVIDGSYQYWLSVPVDSNNQFQRTQSDATVITYTVTDKGDGTCEVTWTEGETNKSVTLNGSVKTGEFKYEWTGADDLYDKAPPEAKLNSEGTAVDWQFPEAFGALLDGVTYSVTFDVTPTQTTLDYIADIMNDPGEDGAWAELPEEIQKYVHPDGSFDTNTGATISWVDTRPGGGSGSDEFDPPDSVTAEAVEQIAVTKQWENDLDSQSADEITLNVTRDGEETYHLTLSKDSETPWSSSVFISIGIMRTVDGEMEILAAGHDFTFTEPEDLTYHWEIDVPVVRPMKIDGVTTMLIKTDEKHQPNGADTYTIDGNEYYVGSTGDASLTATNYRRSSLILTKVVEGDDAPEDAVFPFTLTVNNALAPETEPANDENHGTDYWVWISVRDKDNNRINEGVENATPEDGSNGWYYAPSGTDIKIQAKAGYKIRINNLPTGSTYTITEGDLETGFVFQSAELEITEGEGTDSTFSGDVTTTGTIESTNTIYTVTYTNEYAITDVTVDKVWDDEDDADGLRPETLELTLNGAPDGVEVPEPTVEKSEDGNTWTYTWAGLPKKDVNGKEITYTVSEDEVPEGYECEETTTENGGTITNTHTPEPAPEPVWGDPPVQKIIDGKPAKAETFTFKLAAKSFKAAEGVDVDLTGKMPMPEKAEGKQEMTVTITGEGTEEFGKFPLTVPGTYTYEITEEKGKAEGYTYSEEVHTIVYTVSANADGTLKCTKTVDGGDPIDGMENDKANISKFSFTNKYVKPTVEVAVTKAWDDGDNAQETRPTVVTIALKANGKDTGKTVKLNEDNKWYDIFTDLDKYDENGKEIEYTVEEQSVPTDYTATVSGDAKNGFQVTNKLKTPDTGDHSDIALWTGTMLVSMLGLVLLALIKSKKPAKRSR